MKAVNLSQAQYSLSRLVEAIVLGRKRESVIVCNGHPAARLVPIETLRLGQRIEIAKGQFEVPDTVGAHIEDVARLFLGGEQS